MMSGIGAELSVFLQAILTGNLVYLTYCVLRIIRRIIKHNLFWVSLEDILFWIGTGFFVFIRIFQTSGGSIRWYFVVGILLGGITTHEIISKISKKYIAKRKKRE
jgi:hypothetical protein